MRSITGLNRYFSWISPRLRKTLLIFCALAGATFLLSYYALNRRPKVPDSAALYIALDRPVVEETSLPENLGALQLLIARNPEIAARDVADVIRAAAKDPRIARIVLDLDGMLITPGPATQIISAVQEARKAGKSMLAYGSNLDKLGYLVAASTGDVRLNRLGRIEWQGLAFDSLFYGELLRRQGVHVQIAKAGRYKSAVEPYVRNDLSPDSKAALNEAMATHWKTMIGYAARGTGLAPEALERQAATMTARLAGGNGSAAQIAAGSQLITGPATARSLADLTTLWPGESQVRANPKDRLPVVDLNTYKRNIGPKTCENPDRANGRGGRIAVLTLSGDIRLGETRPGTIGSHSTVAMLRYTLDNPQTAALVLRIDSPGGDAQAAEIIRAELLDYKSRKVPLIISMGTTAASGGYWIASAGDRLYADPLTTTGSIGAFALMPSAGDILARYGVSPVHLAQGGEPLFPGWTSPPSPAQAQALQASINQVYGEFLTIVSDARKLSPAQTAAIAEGRIWAAPDALAAGLIDELGSLEAAIGEAARRARTTTNCAAHIRLPVKTDEILAQISQPKLPVSLQALENNALLKMLALPYGQIQARCLECLNWSGGQTTIDLYTKQL
jgi:protease-4